MYIHDSIISKHNIDSFEEKETTLRIVCRIKLGVETEKKLRDNKQVLCCVRKNIQKCRITLQLSGSLS